LSRFAVELAAWTAAPLAAAHVSPLLAALVLFTLVALPSVFNVPGDKRHTPIPVAGRIRIALELLTMSAAVIGTTAAVHDWAAVLPLLAVVAISVVTGWSRWRWLAKL
jgi:hypothetical protein